MLSPSDLHQIIRWVSDRADEMVIVGGQALAIWEEILQMRLCVQTRDIDILGMAEESEILADQIGGKLILADPMDYSPNLAIISRDNEVLVDFLAHLKGLSETDIFARRILVANS